MSSEVLGEPLLGDERMSSTNTRKSSTHRMKANWQETTFVIVTSFLGAGVLSLPYSASQVGWVTFSILLILVSTGSLLASKCFNILYHAVPGAKVLADIGGAAYGPRMEHWLRIAVYIYVGGIVTIFHLTSTISLSEFIGGCSAYLGLGVAALAFLALQLRNMHDVSQIAVVGSIAIIVPCIMFLVAFPTRGRRSDAEIAYLWPDTSTLTQKAVAFMDLSFAYAGQVIFIELQAGMENPRDLMKSVFASNTLMTVTYAAVTMVSYYFIGQHALRDGEPVSTKLAKGSPTLKVVNAFVFLHVLIAYAVEGNFLTQGILHALGKDDAITGDTKTARATWMFTTGCVVFGAYCLSNLIPFFSDMMSIISAITGVALNFTIPLLLVLKLAPPKSYYTRLLFRTLIALSILVALAGTAASAIDIANKFTLDPPFVCARRR